MPASVSPTSPAAADSKATQEEKSRRIRRWIFGVLIVLAVAVFIGLVSGLIPGIPDPQQKALTVFYRPNAGKEGLSLYLQPPMSMLQVEGRSQSLAMQFTNYENEPIELLDVQVEPSNCFVLRFSEHGPLMVLPRQSIELLPRLAVRPGVEEDSARCRQQSLNFLYRWSGLEAGSHINANSVTTSPVRLIAHWKEFAERLLHALDVVLISFSLPLLLWLLTNQYQKGVDRRSTEDHDQDLKMQVWKDISPVIIKLVTKYYVPISRKMDQVTEEIARLESHDPAGSVLKVLASLLWLRRAVWELYQQEGGWYLRSKRAEQLCTKLSDRLWDECDSYSGTLTLRNLAEGFAITDTLQTIQGRLDPATAPLEYRTLLHDFQTALRTARNLNRIKRLVDLSTRLLDFECDRPLYPEWYEEPPHFDTAGFSLLGLGIDDEEGAQKIADQYIDGIPAECKHEGNI